MIGWPRPLEELDHEALRLFEEWGGLASAREALAQINWDQFKGVAKLVAP